MRKGKDENAKLFNAIEGFTSRLEKELELRAPTKEKIELGDVTSMPTYALATLALKQESPFQVVKVMEAMKKRYARKKNFTNEAMAFLEAIEGKAYGYIALNIKNLDDQQKYYKLALKCFNSAKNKGYYEAMLDLADLEKKMGNVEKGENTAFLVLDKSFESYTKLGELYFDFSLLVTNAVRVLEGKRPLIEDDVAFEYAMDKYKKGLITSINANMYYGLSLIVDKQIDKGLKMVKSCYEGFVEINKDYDKVLFPSDAKIFKENLDLLTTKIVKRNVR